jgi:hypothetical protein
MIGEVRVGLMLQWDGANLMQPVYQTGQWFAPEIQRHGQCQWRCPWQHEVVELMHGPYECQRYEELEPSGVARFCQRQRGLGLGLQTRWWQWALGRVQAVVQHSAERVQSEGQHFCSSSGSSLVADHQSVTHRYQIVRAGPFQWAHSTL